MAWSGLKLKPSQADKKPNQAKPNHIGLKIQTVLSTPYHPQTNGLVERFNRTLCEALAKLTEKEKNWDDHIAPVLFAYCTSQHSITKVTPFLLTHRREATLPMDDPTKFVKQDKGDPLYKHYTEILQDLPNVQQEVQTHVTRQQLQQKQRHDAKIKEITFSIGDKVLMYDRRLDTQWSKKLRDKW